MPPERATLPRSMPVVVSKKSTLPVGVPDPESAVTVALRVKGYPKLDMLAEEVKVVVVSTLSTTSPILSASYSANQIFPSGPATGIEGSLLGVGIGNSVTRPAA